MMKPCMMDGAQDLMDDLELARYDDEALIEEIERRGYAVTLKTYYT